MVYYMYIIFYSLYFLLVVLFVSVCLKVTIVFDYFFFFFARHSYVIIDLADCKLAFIIINSYGFEFARVFVFPFDWPIEVLVFRCVDNIIVNFNYNFRFLFFFFIYWKIYILIEAFFTPIQNNFRSNKLPI